MNNNVFPRMHVSLYVSNIDRTVEFYNRFFRQDATKVKEGYAKYVLESPSLIISFVENRERVKENFGHLGFQIESVEELKYRLDLAKKSGIEVREEVGANCCFALQDKFWVSDPDGIQWEIYYFHRDSEFNDPHYKLEETTACCMPDPAPNKKISLSHLINNNPEPGKCC